eukprot:snap_masked-scaffold_10-processed-gene-2.43-mRNA-1 protein AED:1.00 eAED:1.00 QI:0/0/0/0/1/1/2/0/164
MKGEDQYFCDHCRKKTDAVKKLFFADVPEVLCLHLNRFHSEISTQQQNSFLPSFLSSKNDIRQEELSRVSFSLDINLESFVYSKKLLSGGSRYNLIGLIKHHGSVNSGHYIAQTFQSNKILQFGDDIVSQMTIQKSAARDIEWIFLLRSNRTGTHGLTQLRIYI